MTTKRQIVKVTDKMELTLAKRERIERAVLILAESKSRKARRERLRQHKAIATIVIGALFVAGVIWIVAMSGIEIGDQAEIYSAYKSRPHEAAEFPATGGVVTR